MSLPGPSCDICNPHRIKQDAFNSLWSSQFGWNIVQTKNNPCLKDTGILACALACRHQRPRLVPDAVKRPLVRACEAGSRLDRTMKSCAFESHHIWSIPWYGVLRGHNANHMCGLGRTTLSYEESVTGTQIPAMGPARGRRAFERQRLSLERDDPLAKCTVEAFSRQANNNRRDPNAPRARIPILKSTKTTMAKRRSWLQMTQAAWRRTQPRSSEWTTWARFGEIYSTPQLRAPWSQWLGYKVNKMKQLDSGRLTT